MRKSIAIITLTFALALWPCCNLAAEEVAMVVSGEVIDANTEEPIQGAIVSVQDSDINPVTTNDEGRFKFVILCSEPITVKIGKEGYKTHTKDVSPQSRFNLLASLDRDTTRPEIVMTDFVSRAQILGTVTGIPSGDHGKYKVLVYVLTDKWYIHPSAVGSEGHGYAQVNRDGTWRIGTVFRGYQATLVAFLLVPKETLAPAVVEIFQMDPAGALLARIDIVAKQVIEAPRGI